MEINLQQAVAIALEQAGILFNESPLPPYLEELVFNDNNQTWNITVSVARPVENNSLVNGSRNTRHYKVFNISKEGNVNSVKIREVEPLLLVGSSY